MKRSIIAAMAALLLTTSAQAENQVTLHDGKVWDVWQVARNAPHGHAMCGITAYFSPGSKGGKTFGMFMIKYTAENGLFVNIAKSNWSFKPDKIVPLSITFDDRSDDAWSGEADTIGVPADKGKHRMLELRLAEEAAASFLNDFRTSDKMVVAFKSGNELPWSADMTGSRKAAAVFAKCISDLDGEAPATQPGEAPDEKPSTSNSPDKFRGA